MKKIIYTRTDGGLSVVNPFGGARLANGVTLANGQEIAAISDAPRPVDTFLRGWPVEGATADWAETEDEFVSRIASSIDAEVQIVDESVIPTDRTFRNAWKAGYGIVETDMDKAREIRADALRAIRGPKLEALDVAFMKALEAGDAKAQGEIVAQKQVLRDVTNDPSLAAAITPEQLKEVLPDCLK